MLNTTPPKQSERPHCQAPQVDEGPTFCDIGIRLGAAIAQEHRPANAKKKPREAYNKTDD